MSVCVSVYLCYYFFCLFFKCLITPIYKRCSSNWFNHKNILYRKVKKGFSDFAILAQNWLQLPRGESFFLGLCHSLLMDLCRNQLQHPTVHSGGVSGVPCRSPALFWTLFFWIFLVNIFIDTFCGRFFRTLFVDSYCGHFVNIFCGHFWLIFLCEFFNNFFACPLKKQNPHPKVRHLQPIYLDLSRLL